MHQFHRHRPACLDLRQPAGPTERVIWFGDTIGPELANRRAESYAVFNLTTSIVKLMPEQQRDRARVAVSRKRTFRVSNTQTLKPLLLTVGTRGAGARILIVGLC